MNNYELIESYAKKGESRNIMSALTLLTKAYIDQCGVSLGYRTVIYTAAEQCILHQTVYDELKTYIDSHDVKPCSFIWNPNKDFNIYNEPYKDGYGVYLGKCLRYYVEDKAVADKICEILKKDLTNFVLGRYPIKQRTDE